MNKSTQSHEDYPAAHSMDTVWFAVDKNGFIAAFESAEGGAVPEAALSEHDCDVLGTISEDARRTEVIYAHEDRQSPLHKQYLHTKPRKKWRRRAAKPTILGNLMSKFGIGSKPVPGRAEGEVEELYELHMPILLFVNNREEIEPFLRGTDWQIFPAVEGCAVMFKTLSIEDHAAIHSQQLCKACVEIYSDYEDEEPFRENPSLIGLYFYSCCESQRAYPYGRVSLPSAPLRLDQLPEDLKDKIQQVCFADLSFADTAFIQPAERTKSFSWDGGYLSEDWKHYRANPGQEEEYREMYEANKDYADSDGIEFDPP